MIASLRGKVIFKDTNRVIVDVAGVGYDVTVSLPSMDTVSLDGEVFFHIYTALRENSLELFGFTGQIEKVLFELLITVSGIGPRTAMGILSGITPSRFQQAILSGDVGRLTAIPGVGKKSAERIILELKEKMKKVSLCGDGHEQGSVPVCLEDDLISSLVNLGYRDQHAKAAAKKVLNCCDPGLSLTDAVKSALKELMK